MLSQWERRLRHSLITTYLSTQATTSPPPTPFILNVFLATPIVCQCCRVGNQNHNINFTLLIAFLTWELNVSLRTTNVKKCREISQTWFMGKQLNVRGLLYHAFEGMNRDAIEHEFGRELTSVARECSGQTSVQSALFVTEIACLSRQRTRLLTRKSLREFPWFFSQ